MNVLERLSLALRGPPEQKAGLPFVGASGDGRPVGTDWDAGRATREGLKGNAWVYAACLKISTALGSVPLLLEKRTGDTWAQDAAHPLQALLKQPNPFMGRQDMQERWALDMLLAGNAVWWLNIVQGRPVELWPLKPGQIRPVASQRDFISGYEWQLDSLTRRTLPVEQVGHWMFVDPENARWGLAPLKAAAAAVDLDAAASAWNRAVLRNDGKPSLGITLAEGMDVAQQRVASAWIREQITGGAARQALVLGGTSKIQPLSLTAADLDYLEGRRFSRDEIAAVFGVPSVLLTAGTDATFTNLDGAKAILWEDRIVPLLDDLCGGLMGRLFPYWQLNQDDYRIRADLSGIRALQLNLKTEAETLKLKAEAFKTMVDAGVPGNMAAQASGVPLRDIPGGDEPRQPMSTAPPATKAHSVQLERKDKGDPIEIARRLARMDVWVRELRGRVSELLLEQGSAVASAYAAGQPWEPELSLDEWQMLLEALHTVVMEAEGPIAYSTVLRAITSTGGGGTFDVLADGVTDWIDQHVGDNIKLITDTSKAALRAEIRAGVEAGESVREIATRLRTLSSEWAGSRAELVARTEVGSAFSAAHQQAATQISAEYGVPMLKTWNTKLDGRERDEHRVMNGETVPLDEPFSNGLMQPGEPRCRCVLTYEPAR